MHENNSTNRLLKVVIVLLVLVLIGLFLLAGTIVLADYVDFTENDLPQSSQSEPAQLPEKQPEPEKPVEQPEEPASSGQEIAPPAQPVKPQTSGSSASSSEKETSESSSYQTKTYKDSVSDERKKTYGSVSVQAGDVYLAYKTVKGDMTISRDAEGGIELDHCIIEGTLYIKGGETVVLTNTRVGSIVVRDGYGRETVLIADGLTRIGAVTAHTDVVLDESGLEPNRKGFTELKVAAGKQVVSATLIATELDKATLKEETELYLDEYSYIHNLRVEEPSVIDGSGSVEKLVIDSDGIISYIVPAEEKKLSSRYEDVTYADHNIVMAAPTGLAVTYDPEAKLYRFGWTASDANATGYAVELSAEGTMIAKTSVEPSVVVDDAFMNRNTTFRVRAITTKEGYDPSEWAAVTYTPAQVGEINNFMVSAAEGNDLVLSWDAAANADAYTLSWQQVGSENATTIHDITATSHTIAGLDLSEGKEYRFVLQVVGSAQARPAADGTAEAAFAVKKLAAPAVTAAYADGLLTFSWPAVEGTTNYSVSGIAAEYTATDAGYAVTVEAAAAGSYGLTVKAVGGLNQTEGVLYLDGEEAVKNITATHLEMASESLKIAGITQRFLSVEWAAVPNAAEYDVIMTQNGIEVDRVTAVVPSYSYVAPVGDTILAAGRDYAVSVSVKAPGLAVGSDQLYLNGSAVVVAAAVREEHGIIAEGEGKTHLAKPLTKDAALTLSNLTLSDKYNYSLQLVVGETVHNTIPYTLDEHGLPQLTFGQLMLDDAAEMPTSYTVLLTAADKNAADNIVYLGKTVTVLNVLAE